MKRLAGKVALITGAGTGIGEAIAKKFSLEGALVALVGKPDDPVDAVAAEIMAAGGEAVAYKGDAGEMAFAEAAVAGTVARYGRLDVLIANAGSLVTTGMTEVYPVDAFEQMLHDNCRTVFHCVRAALPELQKTRGCIVAAGSEAGFNGTPQFTPYGATKGWVHSFIKGVAVEQARYGVRANCVCPGAIDSSWTRADLGPMDKKMEKLIVGATPLGRRGTTEEMANVYAFLASDEASFVTGALWLADGGITPAHGLPGDDVPKDLKEEPSGVLVLNHAHDRQPTDGDQ